MSRRTRVPGPIAQDQSLGNTNQRVPPGISNWISLDPMDGSWTKYDPNSTLVSEASSDSGFRFSVDKSKNDSSYRWSNSAQGSVRWYRRLTDADGNFLEWSDFFSVEILIERVTNHANTGNLQDYHGIMVGIGGNGVTNATSNIAWMGMAACQSFANSTNGEGQKIIIGGRSSIESDHQSAVTRGYGVISSPFNDTDNDGNPYAKHCFAYCLDANNKVTNSGADAFRTQLQTFEFTGTDNVYIFCASTYLAYRDLSGLANPDGTFKMWYRVNVARDGLNPTYIPGGGVSGL